MKEWSIVTKPSYRSVGLKWEGTFQEIPSLKRVIEDMKGRAYELEYKINPSVQLGLSYHTVEDGFAHYSVFEVSDEQEVPVGMVELQVPEWSYMYTAHHKGDDVVQTYNYLHNWLAESDYEVLKEEGCTYYDPHMPIKHEYYPIDQDPNDPHFDIFIPVVKKS
ncbi:GyrI-like domain-containing protein [Piscibacillus salipiscarius]|uniref:GyrI-like domain-containing protein n=1 Tax=Piscibacillus salipiscarius TaxID=299480 RepID=A0ABW5Q970_9BACI|nr:GyrI-like domain-containing protein [Piscibacillus salipiscarius]